MERIVLIFYFFTFISFVNAQSSDDQVCLDCHSDKTLSKKGMEKKAEAKTKVEAKKTEVEEKHDEHKKESDAKKGAVKTKVEKKKTEVKKEVEETEKK